MNYFTKLILITALCVSSVNAQEIEIGVPRGWAASESGITKGNNELSVGPVLDVGDLSPSEYLDKLSKVATMDGMEIASISELKDGNIVVQVTREVMQEGSKARSTLFICKKGKNKHRLLELFTVDVLSLISGGKAAIGFCDQP